MKLLFHLMKLLHLMTLLSQQFCLCGIIFNVYDTSMKHALRLPKDDNRHRISNPAGASDTRVPKCIYEHGCGQRNKPNGHSLTSKKIAYPYP